MNFFKALAEFLSKIFGGSKDEKPNITPVPTPVTPTVSVPPVENIQSGDTTLEQIAANAAHLTAGLAGNGSTGPRPAPILTPGGDTPEGRKAWEIIQIKMNHAIMGNGGPALTDEQAEKIWQAQKNPKGGWATSTPKAPKTPERIAEEAAAGYTPKKPPPGYVYKVNPYGDGAPWDVNAPAEPDPASMWHYPGDFGWMSRDEMYSKRSPWLYAQEIKKDTAGNPKDWGPHNPYITVENDPNKGN